MQLNAGGNAVTRAGANDFFQFVDSFILKQFYVLWRSISIFYFHDAFYSLHPHRSRIPILGLLKEP